VTESPPDDEDKIQDDDGYVDPSDLDWTHGKKWLPFLFTKISDEGHGRLYISVK
jgi:hypothetical protein